MNRAISVGTVDSAVGHLVGSTAWLHYFWTTSFFSDTYTVRLKRRLVNWLQMLFSTTGTQYMTGRGQPCHYESCCREFSEQITIRDYS